jgi:choloylglycine hydrolase
MDFSYDIEPHLYVIPKNYSWTNVVTMDTIHDCYSFLGIGQESHGMLGFFDGVNENGFAAAALYFAGYASYDILAGCKEKEYIPSVDFLHFILGQCGSVKELVNLLPNISIVGLPDPVTQVAAPLHWIATDKSGECIVIEQTEKGLQYFQNPIGVMANSPDFPWHLTNLRNYIEVSQSQTGEVCWGQVPLRPFGQAGGTMLLPGGYTSPERFVRTAYQKTHIEIPKNRSETIVACFHIMESVSIPKGLVITDRDTYDYTKYTAFINTNTCEYFFRTYNKNQVTSACLWDYYKHSKELICLGKITQPVPFEKM